MEVVQRRMDWLSAVLDTKGKRLQDLHASCKPGGEGDHRSAAAGSRDVSALIRAGPCQNFESLALFNTLDKYKGKFRDCRSASEVKDINNESMTLRKLFTVLVASCKAAVVELRGAHSRAKIAKEAQAKRVGS